MTKLRKTKVDVKGLVKKGYTEAAFRYKSNANKFATEWKDKGYEVGELRSSGAVVEGGGKHNAYYVIAEKKGSRDK